MSENTAVQGPEFAVLLGMPVVIRSEAMRQVMQLVQRVAQTTASVLITGESGAGKELIARALHQFSLRCNMPWVDVNCGALPEHLMESELFGYERGAFSGADKMKQGLFDLAHMGTLFLDEIGELDSRMQVKLLRALEALGRHGWPGNVRELRNTVMRAAIVASGNEIRVSDLPAGIHNAPPLKPSMSPTSLDEMERQMIMQVLGQTGGHHAKAAQVLGISRRTLSRKLKTYGVGDACEALTAC